MTSVVRLVVCALVTGAIAVGWSAPACPTSDPKAGTACAVPVGSGCAYEIPATHDVFCHCIGSGWDCGVPSGIDVPALATSCPKAHPSPNDTCALPPPDHAGNRFGCFYQAAATPITDHCTCTHPAASRAKPTWSCGRVAYHQPLVDAQGCPSVTPVARSLCTAPAAATCQYGTNLQTSCQCAAAGHDPRAWRCETTKLPPMPGPPMPGPPMPGPPH